MSPAGECPAKTSRRAGLGRPLATLTLLGLSFAFLSVIRWPGPLPPYGSDTDEHLLVARTLVEEGRFDVSGIHATKYPPLVSTLAAAVLALGGDAAHWMVVLNSLCLFTAGLLVFHLARESAGQWCAVAAAWFVFANPTVWNSVHEVKGDVLFLLAFTSSLWFALTRKTWETGTVLVGVLIAAFAVLTRSVGVVVGFLLFVAMLLLEPRPLKARRVILAASMTVLPVGILLVSVYLQGDAPSHPTGYVETFVLRDPYDAAKGLLTLSDLPARLIQGAYSYGTDVATALASPSFNRFVAVLVTVLLVSVPLITESKRARICAAFLVPYSLLIILWPYRSTRFAIPLLPIAALGLAELCRYGASLKRGVRLVLLALWLSHVGNVVVALAREGDEEKRMRSLVQGSLDELSEWAMHGIPDGARLASFDYRALMVRLRRSVTPLAYSNDVQTHWATLCQAGATHLIVSSAIYPLRGEYAAKLVTTLGSPMYNDETFAIYSVDGACERAEIGELERARGGPP